MAQALLHKDDGYNRLAITVQMLEVMVASGTIEDPTRVELIEGELVTMSPVHRAHARMSSKLNAFLRNHLGTEFEVLENMSIRTSNVGEPIADLCVVKSGNETNVVFPNECVLVIEVSESTARRDRLIKAPLYAKAGIPELWIVDLNASETIVHRGPNEAGWTDTTAVSFADELSASFDDGIKVTISTL